MTGDTLDLFLLGACVLFAISGYRQGFVVGVLGLFGFLGGGLVGSQLATPLADLFGAKGHAPLLGLGALFVFASLGQLIATTVGSIIRRRLVWKPLRQLDSVAGASVSVISLLLVAWLIGQAVATSPFVGAARQVRHSKILTEVDKILPDGGRKIVASLRRLVSDSGFPPIFDGLAPERVAPADPPDPAVVNSPAVKAARPDIVKVRGVAPSCSRQLEGSGFIYASQRVMTNAHVLAGVKDPTVEANGKVYDSVVVLFDYNRDVAILYVPGLVNKPLAFDGVAPVGGSAVVAGYPLDGPFDAKPARIRTREVLRGPNIYQSSTVEREIYTLRAKVRSGNSGGPLLAPDGTVYGVIFATSVDDPETGYALTAKEVSSDAAAGRTAVTKVSTRRCD